MSNDYNRGYSDGYGAGFSDWNDAKSHDDRTRRIKELVLTWASQKVHYAPEVKKLIELAAELIDAIDDAEVPKKESK